LSPAELSGQFPTVSLKFTFANSLKNTKPMLLQICLDGKVFEEEADEMDSTFSQHFTVVVGCPMAIHCFKQHLF
jgi:hypothetical protein